MRIYYLFPAAIATVVATLPGAAEATSTTCTTSTVCAEYINTYTNSSPVSGGVAIHGEANGGIGIRGTSVTNVGFYGASGSGSFLMPGVEGESTNTGTGYDAAGAFGLAGLSKSTSAPYFGVVGLGGKVGVVGQTAFGGTSNSTGYGVEGYDPVTSASASGDYNAGLLGSSKFGTGVLAEANGTPTQGIYSTSPIGVYSVAKEAPGTPTTASFAFYGESDDVGLRLDSTSTGYTSFVNTNNSFLLGYGSATGSGTYYITYGGSEYLSGTLTTSKGMYVRTTGSSGAAMREYADRTTTPQVEDFGKGQLRNGSAYVAIDARFSDTIDRRSEYLVFFTPEGDCKGLYVTQKTPGGFTVRESQGGHSSLAFEYRIVAKPIDENGTRLAAMPAETLPKDMAREQGSKRQVIAPPLSIEDDLKRRLGTQGYAKALAALRARLAGR